MIILDKPYVSDLLASSLVQMKIPVLKNLTSEEIATKWNINLLDEKEFIHQYNQTQLLYTNSENSIEWINKYLNDVQLAKNINVFKDKVKFRQLLKDTYPNFFFKELNIDQLDEVNIEDIKTPFILKPVVGFFSIGVYKISNREDWIDAKKEIKNNLFQSKQLYAKHVIDGTRFIIEQYIEGDEFAIDAYFNSDGEAVVLNILKHDFSSDTDVSDRVYYTSKIIIEKYRDQFENLLRQLNKTLNLKNFPLHFEVRVNAEEIIPIEINPMRFAGWCTTDIAYYSYGINVYEYFFQQKKPNWNLILKDKGGKLFSIVVLDIPNNIDQEKLVDFHYEKLLASFEQPLQLRKIDFHKYPVFGFLFLETKNENMFEITNILKSDLREYIEFEA